MNKSRPVATETVKSLNYTKNILQTIPNNDTMEVVTQTNAVTTPELMRRSKIFTMLSCPKFQSLTYPPSRRVQSRSFTCFI